MVDFSPSTKSAACWPAGRRPGSYFWCADQLIVPVPGIAAMTAAIRELVRTGDITSAGIRCDAVE
jgi:hypothetical protein